MDGIWKALPGWVRNIVVPVALVIVVLWLVFAIIGAILGAAFAVLGFVIKLAALVALGAVVVILVKKASR